MMKISAGVNVYTVDNVDTRATSVGTNRTKNKGKQSHRLGDQTRQLQKVKRRKTERQVNVLPSMTTIQGERVRKKRRRSQKMSLQKRISTRDNQIC